MNWCQKTKPSFINFEMFYCERKFDVSVFELFEPHSIACFFAIGKVASKSKHSCDTFAAKKYERKLTLKHLKRSKVTVNISNFPLS